MLTDCRLTDMLLLKNVGTRAVLGLLYVTVVPLGDRLTESVTIPLRYE